MKDLSTAERRLIAALDRVDHALDRAAQRIGELSAAPAAAPATPVGPAGAPVEIAADIAALHQRQAATLDAVQGRLAEAHRRLSETGEQAARLAAANEALVRANRQLVAAAGGAPGDWARDGGAAALAAVEAEVEALRAARAAEIAQMGDILDALDRMLGVPPLPGAAAPDAAIVHDAGDALPEDSPQEAVLPHGIAHDEDPLPEDEPDLTVGSDDPPETGAAAPATGSAADPGMPTTQEERR